ncbi:MAG: hypothetical protein AAFU41_00685 [Pseudomonadota bacterium]
MGDKIKIDEGTAATVKLMTPEELRGFEYACERFEAWGCQMMATTERLANVRETVPIGTHMKAAAKLMRDAASALKSTTRG